MPERTFGPLLRRARKRAGLTQENLGKKAGLTGSYISMLESGRKPAPHSRVVSRLAKALGTAARPLQDAAALERAPDPLRRKLKEMERDGGSARRSRDRLLSTTLYHVAHRRGVLEASAAYMDMPLAQRSLLSRLLGRVRHRSTDTKRDASPEPAPEASETLLEDATDEEREALAAILPQVLAGEGESPPTLEPTRSGTPAPTNQVPVHAALARRDPPLDRLRVDPRQWHARAFYWRVPDDQAWPRIEAGDLLLLDPVATPRTGDLVALEWEGRDILRRVHRSPSEIRLDPVEGSERPIRVPLAGFEPVGVVVQLVRTFEPA